MPGPGRRVPITLETKLPVSMPGAMTRPNRVPAANAASEWIGLSSPLAVTNSRIVSAVTV